MATDLSLWPGTLWTTSGEAGPAICVHCHRDYSYHGASEIVTRKKGLRLNQRHLVCRPLNDINPDAMSVGGADVLREFGKANLLMKRNDSNGNTNTK